MEGMVPPFSTSCADHTGHSGAWILEWDGEKFAKASDLLQADVDGYSELLAASAKENAEANAPWPVNESCDAMN
jgi:branched-chain amino acid transport system substrate-binding protein